MDTSSLVLDAYSSSSTVLLGASDTVDPFNPIFSWRFIVVPILAFFCEFVDSAIGMGYGTTLTPVLLTPNFGYDRQTIVQSVLISELATGILATLAHSMMKNIQLGCNLSRFLPDCLRTRVDKADQEDEVADILELEATNNDSKIQCHPGPGGVLDIDAIKNRNEVGSESESGSDEASGSAEDNYHDASRDESLEDSEIVVKISVLDAPETDDEINRHSGPYYRLARWLNNSMTIDMQTIVVMSFFGFFGTVISAVIGEIYKYTAGQKFGIKVYIGVMTLSMGIIIIIFTITQKRIKYALWKISILGLITGFNKGISGGGYGPLSVSGQLLCGRPERNAIASTSASEAVISFFGVVTAFLAAAMGGSKIDGKQYRLVPYLIIGALISVPFAAYATRIVRAKFLKWVVGIATCLLGVYTLISSSLDYTGVWKQ